MQKPSKHAFHRLEISFEHGGGAGQQSSRQQQRPADKFGMQHPSTTGHAHRQHGQPDGCAAGHLRAVANHRCVCAILFGVSVF
jgi:hypothetical protein